MTSGRTSYDVVIVGGGHNGLVAATYLARTGLSTLVLERREHTGGAAGRLSSYADLIAPMPEALAADLGLDLPLARPRPLHSGIADIADLVQVVAPTLLQPLPLEREVRDRVGAETWCDYVTTPLGATIETRFDDDAARGAVATDSLIGTFVSLHDESLAQNRTFLYRQLGREGRRPEVEVLARAAVEAGAEILTSAGVSSIRGENDGAEVSWHDGMTHHTVGARFVLSNVAPWVLRILLGGPEDLETKPEGALLVMRLMLDRPGADGTDHVGTGYAQLQAAYDEAAAGRMPSTIPGQVHRDGLALTYVGLHLPARLFVDDPQGAKDQAVARALASLEEHAAHPVEALTPHDIEHDLAMPGGHIFHGDLDWPWAPNRARMDTPAQRWGVQTDVDSVLVCGSGSRRGGAVAGIGGHNAAHAVLDSI